jgi:hypothetical protein
LKRVQSTASFANCDDFRMSTGIVCGQNLIRALANDLRILDNHGSKWSTIVRVHVFQREGNRPAHEIGIQMLTLRLE